jgi:hypothetical protein
MAGRPEGVGIATLLVSLSLVALTGAGAKPDVKIDSAVNSGETDTCAPNLAGANYVGGVDVSRNRIAPADIGGGSGVDLSQISATPVLVPGRHGRQVEVVVQGVEPAKPPCERPPH